MKGLAGELAALVGVEDLWPTLAQGLFQSRNTEVYLQGVGQPPGQHVAAVPVPDGHQVEETPSHGYVGDVGDVGGPHLVDPVDLQPPEREIIGMDVGTSEDGAFWLAFLRSLSARGLGGVELVVSDAHQGLRGAIPAVFGGASWQRCRTHFMTNLLTRVPRRAQPWVATMVRTIYQQPSPDEVHAQLDRVSDQLQNRFPQVASLLDEAGPDVLAFSNFPLAHWKKIWSNNPQERLNKEIRRRTDVVGIFPNRPAVRRLVGAVLAEQHDEWAVGRRYITPVLLTFNEALPEADLAEATAA